MENKGWVKLHRCIENNELWFLEPFTKAQAWLDLFLNANHKDGVINIRGNIVNIKRGQIGWSELTMMKRWQWSRDKVRRYLGMLETRQQIIQQKYKYITTIITIIKYEEYQKDDNTIQQTIQQKDSRRYINKNVKNEKNKEVAKSDNTPIKEIIAYFCDSAKEKYNFIYKVNAIKDVPIIKSRLKEKSVEDIKNVLNWYFTTDKSEEHCSITASLSISSLNLYEKEKNKKKWNEI